MSHNKCKIFLLSGFLGSGKTTLLKHLVSTVPDAEKIAVLMNEFGKAGVDGDVIRKNGLEIIEVSRGSIFCACAKGDFLRALYTIFRDHKPTVLLIEASGVADTTDMERDLGYGMLHDYYQMEGNICVVDAQHFEEWLDLFNAVIKQVQAASHIVINKTDLVSAAELKNLDAHISGINPDAKIRHAEYGNISWKLFMSKDVTAEKAPVLPMSEEWEKYIEQALSDNTAHLTPPDKLSSLSIFWEGNPEVFKKLLNELPEDIIRSKGYFKDTDHKWKVFDIVGNAAPEYSEPEADFAQKRNLAIFIRTKKARREIPALFQDHGLKLLEVRF